MRVKLHYRTINGKQFAIKEEITVKQAKKYFEEELQKQKDITEVYLTHFDGWHRRIYKYLKRKIK